MRLIDADALKKIIEEDAYIVDYSETGAIYGMYIDGIEHEIDAQPTIELEREKGKWHKCGTDRRGYSDTYECSECECLVTYAYYCKEIDYEFCPNCGARMVGDEE